MFLVTWFLWIPSPLRIYWSFRDFGLKTFFFKFLTLLQPEVPGGGCAPIDSLLGWDLRSCDFEWWLHLIRLMLWDENQIEKSKSTGIKAALEKVFKNTAEVFEWNMWNGMQHFSRKNKDKVMQRPVAFKENAPQRRLPRSIILDIESLQNPFHFPHCFYTLSPVLTNLKAAILFVLDIVGLIPVPGYELKTLQLADSTFAVPPTRGGIRGWLNAVDFDMQCKRQQTETHGSTRTCN